MPEDREGVWLNRAFLALSVSMRREIVEIILARPGISVNDLCRRFPVSRFTIMRHLNVLEEAHVLGRERRGNAKNLTINQKNLEKVVTGWLRKVTQTDGDAHKGGNSCPKV